MLPVTPQTELITYCLSRECCNECSDEWNN